MVSEVRGPQSGENGYGEWIEVFNATGSQVDLKGLSVQVIKLDGSSRSEFLIRRSLPVSAGAYAVFGNNLPGLESSHVDYGYGADFPGKLPDSAAIEITTCGERADLLVYRNLPPKGSLILTGEDEPDATTNDDELAWCVDEREDEQTPNNGIKGTPQEANPVCE